jgi:predicted AlkP superfamily phosphohydrolase/phosphomutase
MTLHRANRRAPPILLLVVLSGLGAPADAWAYIGPGAGFALLSSFFVLFTTILVVFLSFLLWPIRIALRILRGGRRPKASIGRLIVIGFDGQEPSLTDRWLREGKLPNLRRLADLGCYHRLRTTFPAISPVAWSSFSTGTNPAKHNIFDFLDRDRRTYLPILSSTHIGGVRRVLKLGRYRVPLGRPELRLLRRSKPFWAILGEHRIWSTILRVPITFPPDRFYGAELSAMCVPDLLGTQGTFTLYTTRPAADRFKEGGTRVPLQFDGDTARSVVTGPENAFLAGNPALELPLAIALDRGARRAQVNIDGTRVALQPGVLSDWIPVTFRAMPGVKIAGICRALVTEMGEHFSLYLTPVNIDPERPAMPISHPSYYATYLAKKIGPYATLGLAEDTWALNEGVTDEAAFLRQTLDIDTERQQMFFAALDRLRRGALVCVFDATDRIQHMFWRQLEDRHPRHGSPAGPAEGGDGPAEGGDGPAEGGDRPPKGGHYVPGEAIEQLYRRNDALLGTVLERLGEGDVLMVLSDHGFNAFRRGVNLNAWLLAEGYLRLKPGADGSSEWLRDVDWSATRAYSLGLVGIFLNLTGREASGIVEPGVRAEALKAEIIAKLSGLRDHGSNEIGIVEVFDTARLYAGPYLGNAPDLLVGYNAGYRISWDGATGMVSGPVFEDNRKAWSGDHCIDPRLVPGVFFCNRPIATSDPALVDIAPTALRLFGIDPPAYMDGKPLFDAPASAGVPGVADTDTEPEQQSAAAAMVANPKALPARGQKG